MEGALSSEVWRGKRVLITGHTGFKGGWLALLLDRLGAQVTGYALQPETNPNLFSVSGVDGRTGSVIGDLRDRGRLTAAVRECRPEVVFHLGAQALVRRAYADPVETFETNVIGTVNLLEALRDSPGLQAVVVVTSDKVYDNREWPWAYRETDVLGGKEPYGLSKACAEFVTEAYRNSYFTALGIPICTARAGNVVGGGDWSADRLVPDAMRAWSAGLPVRLRNPAAVRPWQHVVDAVRGYLLLAERMLRDRTFSGAWNFGPTQEDARSVSWAVDRLAELWGDGASWVLETGAQPYEAQLLAVDSSRAIQQLGWRPTWRLEDCLARTVAWYRAFYRGEQDIYQVTLGDIDTACHADA